MPQSSQSGPPKPPNPSTPRRLQTPAERFGTEPPPAPVETAPDPFVALPDPFVALPAQTPVPMPPRTSKGARSKKRHERHRFEREARRAAPRRTVSGPDAVSPTHTSPPELEPEPESAPSQNPENSPRMAPRRNRRQFWKRLGALTVFALVIGVGAGALCAPQMNIERVEISGLHATSPVLVKPIAARLLGHNVFRADKSAIARGVERLPTVQSARVVLSPDFPPRVELQVVERQPVVRVGAENSWWVADESGLPYRRANAHDAHLPALTWNGPVQTLKALDEKQWQNAARLASALREQQAPKNGLKLGQIRAMQLDSSGDATLHIEAPDGGADLILKLGNDQWSEKLARARVALVYFARTKRRAAQLNLISLALPRWTPRDAAPLFPTPAPPA